MARIFVTRKIPKAGLDLLKEHDVTVGPEGPTTPEAVLEGAKGADAILSVLTEKIDPGVMDAAGEQLKIISNYAVGYDNVDVAEAKKREITVTNTPGVLTQAVAEHAWALIMSVARRTVEADRYVRAGKYDAWGPELLLGQEMKGKTLGILGMGRIGYEVGRIGAQGFQMKVNYTDPYKNEHAEKDFGANQVEQKELFETSDVLSIHVNLTDENVHLVNKDVLAHMHKNAILINTSRGPIVDEAALVEALKNKEIFGAGLDVFEDEPKLKSGLDELDNAVLTPHIASGSQETRDAMAKMAAQAILDVLSGKTPEHPVE